MSIRNINYRKWVGITVLSLLISGATELISHAPSFSDLCRDTLILWFATLTGYEIGECRAQKKEAKHDCDF